MGLLSRIRSVVIGVAAEIVARAAVDEPSLPVKLMAEPTRPIVTDAIISDRLPSAPSLISIEDDIEENDSAYDEPVATAQTEDRLRLLRALGLTPLDRPMYEAFGEKLSDERPSGEKSEAPYNDTDFSTWLVSNGGDGFSFSPLYVDIKSQLPAASAGIIVFHPAASVYGSNLSMIDSSITALDLELAALGWVRYVAHISGPKIPSPANENLEAAGTMWEGYVHILKDKTRLHTNAAVKLVAASGCKILMPPSKAIEAGLPFSSADAPAPWIIIYLNKALTAKFLRA